MSLPSTISQYPRTQVIGHICSVWASLEHEIDQEIWWLSGLTKEPLIGACITNEIVSVHTKLKILANLCRARDASPHLLKKANKFNNELYSVSDQRNRAIHDPWEWDPNIQHTGQRNLARNKEAMSESVRHTTSETLFAITKEIQGKRAQFRQIRVAIRKSYPAPTETPHPTPPATPTDQSYSGHTPTSDRSPDPERPA